MSETVFISEKICPICQKHFTVLWPSKWSYKRGNNLYLCSWKCLRKWDDKPNKKEELKVEKDSKKHDRKAIVTAIVEMYEAGRNKTEVLKYLSDAGYRVPEQTHADLKAYAKAHLPGLYAKFPEEAKAVRVVHTVEDASKIVGNYFGAETPDGEFLTRDEAAALAEAANVQNAELSFRIRSIQTDLGTYAYDDEFFEFKSAKNRSDAIELDVNDFVALVKEAPKVMKLLGVEL